MHLRSLLCALILAGCASAPAPLSERTVLGTHRLIQTDEQDGYVEAEAAEGFFVFRALREVFSGDDSYQGSARARAKTSFPDADMQSFASIVALRATLEADDDMRQRSPPIAHGPNSGRVAEEERMVRVTSMLIAVSREDDNDYHLIVADPRCRNGSCRLNVEVSGLPGSRSPYYAALRDARTQFDEAMDGPIGSGYAFFQPAVRVTIEGALFYDIDHAPGLVGPSSDRPDTSWEIHPITSIEFHE